MATPRRNEWLVTAVIFLPLGVAVNGLLLWGTQDVAMPTNAAGWAVNVALVLLGVWFYRRAARCVER
ncbi:MAG TPA: hypothetical protein VM364_18720 [Vicinamibacterales bacterium]|nr:hypothetical protein [Vicinamibacterales bacterium]